jgi:hypothetical protein
MLTMQLSGDEWAIVAGPDLGPTIYEVLTDVSCASADYCVAVGGLVTESFEGSSVARVWDGEAWTTQALPEGTFPVGISCVSSSNCTAVSEEGQALHWDGGEWATQTTPKPEGATTSKFTDIQCTSPIDCIAVGHFSEELGQFRGYAVTWDGDGWTLIGSDLPGTEPSVVCSAVDTCYLSGTTTVQSWDGTELGPVEEFAATGGAQEKIEGMACVSQKACVAVGHFVGPRSLPGTRPLVQRLTGSWSLQPTPNLESKTESALDEVSCTSAAMCLAVGYDDSQKKALLQRWDGSDWKIALSDGGKEFSDISCVTVESIPVCTLVGTDGGDPYFWQWHASQGSMIGGGELPAPAGATVTGVSCTAYEACTAVAHYSEGGVKPLAMRWDGEAWTTQSTPAPSGEEGSAGRLLDVSCGTASSCMAVGYKSQGGKEVPFAESWNGSSWSIVATPGGSQESHLVDVSCPSASACMAVGWIDGETRRALALSWDGSQWSASSTPTPSESQYEELSGVTCTSASFCVAVGGLFTDVGKLEHETLVEAWDGEEWAIQASPGPEGKNAFLTGASCSSSSACTAVGVASSEGERFTLGMGWE